MGREKPWTFDQWFEAQHGSRGAQLGTMLLRDSIEAQKLRLAADERLLRSLEDWDAKRTSAMYAWNVKPEEKR